MRTLFIVVGGTILIFCGLFAFTGHAWTAGAAATGFALLASCVVCLRLGREIRRPSVRWGTTALVLLLGALIAAQWATASLVRVASLQGERQTRRLMAHASIKSIALDAGRAPELMHYYYGLPASRRPPFGVAAREYILGGPTKMMFQGDLKPYGVRILPSADSELVISGSMVYPPDPGGHGDSLVSQGRVILTAQGGRYVIDR
jgi:hypothetical protein